MGLVARKMPAFWMRFPTKWWCSKDTELGTQNWRHRTGDTERGAQNEERKKGGEDLLVIKGVVYAPLSAGHGQVIMCAVMPGL